jgi:hypothetical protein
MRERDPTRKPSGQSMMPVEELAIEQLYRFAGDTASVAGCGLHGDLDATIQVRFRQNCSQQSAHGIGKVAIEQILKLSMSQNRK